MQQLRRATTWVWFYQMSRGLFRVQYVGMSDEAIESALKLRAAAGYAGGMPPGATITLEEAGLRVLAGEFAYLPQLESEPFFVKLAGRRGKGGGKFVYTQTEMGTEWFGSVFRDVGDELGYRPHASGLNSVRRNAMVNVQKGAEHAGFDAAMHAKKVSQHRGDGQACREKVYEDSTATTDIGAFLMGRTPQRIEKLRSLAMTRVPDLAIVRKPSDVDKADAIRVLIVDSNEQRLAVQKALDAYAKVVKDTKSAAQRSQARGKVQMLTHELGVIVRRLEARMLEEKRQQVYADGQRALADMPIEEFKARKEVRDLSSLTREGLLTKYLVGATQVARVPSRIVESCVIEMHTGELLGVRDCSREESRLRRVARRAEQLGFELDEGDQPPLLMQIEAAAEVVVTPEVEQQVVNTASCSEPLAAEGLEGTSEQSATAVPRGRMAKRVWEDGLLVEYENSGMSRADFAGQTGVKLGTLDGHFARARKRREAVTGGNGAQGVNSWEGV